jgi:predicted O-methyltransferase YrrM
MRRLQTFHETLIPLLVEGMGAESYLEFGTYRNDTIGRVRCHRRYGVDTKPIPCPGVEMFAMTTKEFIKRDAALLAPFDFVLIDADHSEAAVRADFFGIIDYVRPEGIVCLHDTNPELLEDTQPGLCGDSWGFARSLYLSGYECVTLPYHPGLTIVRNRKKWGPE